MPELPEVETVKRGLSAAMEGAHIKKLELRRGDLRFPFPEDFEGQVSGRTIIGLGRRAKYLLIDLDSGKTIISHLGMSGSFRIEAGSASGTPGDFHYERSKDERHDHAIFHLEGKDGPRRVIYNDPRRFGFMDIADRSELQNNPFLFALGPEPTGNELSAAYLAERFAGKAQPLKGALLDQKTIAGLGNIYVSEALWRAHLMPTRAAGTLVTKTGRPKEPLNLLVASIRDVIADAIKAGGSSLRDHIQTDGSLGYFQHAFSVYDREGHPCRTPGCGGTVSRIVQAGRSTFYCPVCQK
ncbi:bifunctional DNA-formamidopyrimidine glycosylase/DNA-(apurinic or apyrimidinic site) lyase [Rhizobium sp. P32RR-XVIII]|uniref:bifunctional DNA-formamidopyrimidine glycosylase/DNA-(apurinic or apyrimidinic site) lyase n=1 Tax=Rhizobium sp. P32RR-XVIII TaxID=2726738 RepID=UPI00145749CB|nr:bifunctional DNA-formamidopyrimidine glycosylase/DNA-(apurinic or apyrimidinic site) lyase [Rhizobium sp. P32RR-XVIII]NLS02041.1 bifunctional DNA-formamidopyrimidine glycosylase/DNA-(apurinic or apyrimidinic site) lyase [Rhizobium sp. P32RR-XVIII]